LKERRLLIALQHLHKVQEHYTANRMNAGNLAICFGYVTQTIYKISQ
jgi:hypothetical protein